MERYPHSKLSDTARVEYQSDWIRLAESVGVERFEQALASARLQCGFMPQASDLNEHMPPPDLGRPSRHDPDCPLCGGSAWIMVAAKVQGKAARATRCKGVQQHEG